MSNWVPFWSMAVDSSLWEEPDHVVKVFLTMLAVKDSDHVVRYDSYKLAKKAHKTEQETIDALNVLSSPDRRRLTPQEFEGRRIQLVDDGWLVLNGEKYKQMMRKFARGVYQADWQKAYRAANPKPRMEPPTKPVRVVFKKPTIEEVRLHAAKIGLSDAEADRFFSYYESNGWRVGKNPMRSWQAAMTTWKLNSHDRPTVPVKREFKKPTSPLIAKMRAAGERQEQAECDRDKGPL